MGRFVGRTADDWGTYVYVKTNAVELFRREIVKPRFASAPTIFISSVTDAWQGPERKGRLTRGILGVLLDEGYQGRVSILTKSPLIMRDFDLIEKLRWPKVGITGTTDDDAVGRLYEAQAPRNTQRLAILQALSQRQIPSYAFIGPLFTHYVDAPEKLDRLIAAIAASNVKYVYAELLNSAPKLMRCLLATANTDEASASKFVTAQLAPQRRQQLSELVKHLIDKHELVLRLGQVMDHSKR